MKHRILAYLFLLLLFIFVIPSCDQSDPSFNQRDGDMLKFAGRDWIIKHSPDLLGPGNNYFSDHPNDVWIDDQNYLHLSVNERNGVWYCTEVVSADTFGYGTYVWTVQADLKNMDVNIVLGLFTWDNNTFQEEANSEVDIEFARWGEDTVINTIQYGVQPIAFVPPGAEFYNERKFKPDVPAESWVGISTHAFTWTDSLITWESWLGPSYQNGPPIATWYFDQTNPPRRKYENGLSSDPIVIPAPGNTTNARMNLWLFNGVEGPNFGIGHEVIIRDFQFIPL